MDKIDDEKIIDLLLDESYISKEDLKDAREKAKKENLSVLDFLISNESISKDIVGQALAESIEINYADLNTNTPSKKQVLKIPQKIYQEKRVVPFNIGKDKVVIATDRPTQENIEKVVQEIFPEKQIEIRYSLPEDIDDIAIFYRKALKTRFAKIIEESNEVAPKIIDEIFADAITFKASDIHFEPQEEDTLVRFRVDGVLQEAGRIPNEYYPNILNRIKIDAKLRIDEHFRAQDGSLRYEDENVEADMRVSIVPTLNGEKVVLRILAEYMRNFSLTDLGLSVGDQKQMEEVSKKPFGMILTTGPTGSGKTTTLYALVKILNKPDVNITTIEDPVEYRINGINQIQVRKETNLTFANGLRSIVRQDPDIILVGEIRDRETAEISVNAALTGHLLFSTFHANDSATSIPRLLDMGIEPFLLASTLEGVAAQRLLRKICDNCKHSQTKKVKELGEDFENLGKYFDKKEVTLYEGKGCKVCGHTGYSGRTIVFEFIKITPEMEELILRNPSSQEIWKLARKQGAKTLFEDGLEKVKKGITTLEELMRVAEPPEEVSKK